MIDFHMHTFLSDGELSPNELVQRARKVGYTAMAITDHGDTSNIEFLAIELTQFCKSIENYYNDIVVLPGIELTHIPPEQINDLAEFAKAKGLKVVVVHGETIVEPVEEKTNMRAVESKFVDILAHPGIITEDVVELAVKNEKYIEITSRKGHSAANGHVAKICKKWNAKILLNTDTHKPENLITQEYAIKILRGAGLEINDIPIVFQNSLDLLRKIHL